MVMGRVSFWANMNQKQMNVSDSLNRETTERESMATFTISAIMDKLVGGGKKVENREI